MPLTRSMLQKLGAKEQSVELVKQTVGIEKQRSNVVASIDAHIKAYINRDRDRDSEGKLRRVKRVTKAVKGSSDEVAVDLRYGATEQIKLSDEPKKYLTVPRSKERETLEAIRQAIINGALDDEIQDAADRVTETMNRRVLSARKGAKKAAPKAADEE